MYGTLFPVVLLWQMERFEQNELHLQTLLQSSEEKNVSLRLSSKDWASWRKRLTRLWALRCVCTAADQFFGEPWIAPKCEARANLNVLISGTTRLAAKESWKLHRQNKWVPRKT